MEFWSVANCVRGTDWPLRRTHERCMRAVTFATCYDRFYGPLCRVATQDWLRTKRWILLFKPVFPRVKAVYHFIVRRFTYISSRRPTRTVPCYIPGTFPGYLSPVLPVHLCRTTFGANRSCASRVSTTSNRSPTWRHPAPTKIRPTCPAT